MPAYQWQRIGRIWNVLKTPVHAGLSCDGEHFFLAERDDEAYSVVNVHTGKTVWQVQRNQDYPPLTEWIENGHIDIIQGSAKGRYRIFGLQHNYSLLVDDVLAVGIKVDQHKDEIVLVDLETQQEFRWLPYELPSAYQNKWAVASFSDDGSTIAVMVDHAATFFRHNGPAHKETEILTNTFIPTPIPGAVARLGSLQGAYEHPQHAGLSIDGRKFMLVEYKYTGTDYFVIDIVSQEVLWQSDWISGQHLAPALSEWIKDGFVEIQDGPAAGRYRIFGLEEGKPLLVSPVGDLALDLDEQRSQLILRDATTLQEFQRLNYRPSDDWTFVSFSDDGSAIAVLANHAVTFFSVTAYHSRK